MIQNWEGFVASIAKEWEQTDLTAELIRVTGDKDLAVAIWVCLRRQSIDWMSRPVPMLAGRRPSEMLDSEEARDELRWLLMSNPWWRCCGHIGTRCPTSHERTVPKGDRVSPCTGFWLAPQQARAMLRRSELMPSRWAAKRFSWPGSLPRPPSCCMG